MTEAEWEACEEPERMLSFLGGNAGRRKLGLLAAACCRSVWRELAGDPARRAVEELERAADGPGSPSADASAGTVVIRCPTVGKVCAHRESGAPPMVAVGSLVAPDTSLCLIEAMTIFTRVAAR
ncbi:MAG: acetyl-CoA carboxylase biotin carboxyl carrier protein subunit [Gemmataceae bacterium]|nr:acetyl-CoA carboxylase biotin carboxyl carrier protein subunit [Gemmataceae bacterium]